MNAVRRRAGIRVVIAIAIMALAAACQATRNVDKTGGDTTVLRLATFEGQVNANGQNYGPQAFVDNLRKLSGGRLKVELTTDYGGDAPDAESRLVRAIASGEVDGGWPSTRAFANAGISGLGVVEAPMTITSYAAEKALVSGPVAGKLLSRLDGTGVVGLGLTVGPLRRPFAAKAPLLGPGDWQGVRFRVFNSPVQADAVRALGATPVNLSLSFIDELKAGTLRGAEFDIPQYEHNGFAAEAGHVTANVVLWPKVFVLASARSGSTRSSPNSRHGRAKRPSRPSRRRSMPPTARLRPCGSSATGASDSRTRRLARSRVCAPSYAPCSTGSPRNPPTRSCSVTSRRLATRIQARKSSTYRPAAGKPSPVAGRWVRFRRRSQPSPTACTAGSSPSKTSPRREEILARTRRASGRSRFGEEPTRCTAALSRVRVTSAAEASRTSRSRSGICG